MKRNLTIIENYFEDLCTYHKKLRHGDNGKKAFYRLTGEESSALNTNAADKALHIDGYSGRYQGQAELLSKPVNLTLKVLVKSEGNSEAQREAAYITAEEIMDDLIAKISFDINASIDCFPLYNIDFTSIAFDRIGPEGQNSFGYRFVLPIRGDGPSYDSKNWM